MVRAVAGASALTFRGSGIAASWSAFFMSAASRSAAMSVAREMTRLAALMFAATWSARLVS